jgi:hypothetical protein
MTQVLTRAFGAAEDRCAGAETLRNERGGPVEHLLGGCRTKVIAVADNSPANQWLAVPLVV